MPKIVLTFDQLFGVIKHFCEQLKLFLKINLHTAVLIKRKTTLNKIQYPLVPENCFSYKQNMSRGIAFYLRWTRGNYLKYPHQEVYVLTSDLGRHLFKITLLCVMFFMETVLSFYYLLQRRF